MYEFYNNEPMDFLKVNLTFIFNNYFTLKMKNTD